MALSSLREQLRSDLRDVSRLQDGRMFENEYLEGALFQALQQHNRTYTWQDVRPEEEQLICLLAKAKICWDKSLEYALEVKVQAGSGFVSNKLDSSSALREIAKDLREEYELQRTLISSSDSDSGDIFIGTLVRDNPFTLAQSPSQAATRPPAPQITSAHYSYDSQLQSGTISWQWKRMREYNLAFIKILLSRNFPVTLSDTVVRTLYDVYTDPVAAPFTPALNQQGGSISYTLMPTGRWYMAMAAFNWNKLYSVSPAFPLDVENSITIPVDSFAFLGS